MTLRGELVNDRSSPPPRVHVSLLWLGERGDDSLVTGSIELTGGYPVAFEWPLHAPPPEGAYTEPQRAAIALLAALPAAHQRLSLLRNPDREAARRLLLGISPLLLIYAEKPFVGDGESAKPPLAMAVPAGFSLWEPHMASPDEGCADHPLCLFEVGLLEARPLDSEVLIRLVEETEAVQLPDLG